MSEDGDGSASRFVSWSSRSSPRSASSSTTSSSPAPATPAVVRVLVDRPRAVGSDAGGVDLDTIADATAACSPRRSTHRRRCCATAVHARGQQPRPRAPAAPPRALPLGAVGVLVSVKYAAATARPCATAASVARRRRRRHRAHARGRQPARTIASRTPTSSHARTVFEWGPAPRPGRGSKPGKGAAQRQKESSRS